MRYILSAASVIIGMAATSQAASVTKPQWLDCKVVFTDATFVFTYVVSGDKFYLYLRDSRELIRLGMPAPIRNVIMSGSMTKDLLTSSQKLVNGTLVRHIINRYSLAFSISESDNSGKELRSDTGICVKAIPKPVGNAKRAI
jgi:hypothetical protein